jgi:hypothetical protein
MHCTWYDYVEGVGVTDREKRSHTCKISAVGTSETTLPPLSMILILIYDDGDEFDKVGRLETSNMESM